MIPRHLIIGIVVMLVIALGMSLYVMRMRGNAGRQETAAAGTQPVAPPVSGPTEQVTLYVAYDQDGSLRAQSTRIPLPAGRQERAEELLRALVNIYLGNPSPHPLGPGSEVRDVYLVDPGLAVIDLNGAFAQGHRSGVLVEELTLASLIQTLSANIPGVTRVKILVEGKERESLAGHAALTNFYDTAAMGQAVREMQAGQ
ncbi:MAG: GerMN domain-containing protein [Terriglobales bacterium]